MCPFQGRIARAKALGEGPGKGWYYCPKRDGVPVYLYDEDEQRLGIALVDSHNSVPLSFACRIDDIESQTLQTQHRTGEFPQSPQF